MLSLYSSLLRASSHKADSKTDFECLAFDGVGIFRNRNKIHRSDCTFAILWVGFCLRYF